MRAIVVSLAVGAAAIAPGAANAAAAETTNSVGMALVLIQPGSMQVGVFTPGCPSPAPAAAPPSVSGAASAPARAPDPRYVWSPADYDACAKLVAADSSPGFPVRIAKPYYIGKYEVTQAQWVRVMGQNPSTFQGPRFAGDFSDHPVESVTWKDAQAFVAKLNQLEHTTGYRLPTEFEWEYACRAGGAGQQAWKDIRATAFDGGASLGFGAGVTPRAPDRPPPTTAKAGSMQPNAWGLHDMLGNVWEWVQDPYNDKMFADPKPASSGSVRVLKGGGFLSDVKNAICATHAGGPGDGWDVGFRVVKSAD